MDGAILLPGNNQMSTYEELYREYLEDRTLVLNDEIDDNVIEDFILYILKWNKEDINLPPDVRRPIKFFISSPGGNVFDANILIDVITASKTPVWGIGLDLVASAGYLIFLACHKRFSFNNTAYLQHEGVISIENSRSKAKNNVEFFDQQEARAKEFILSHTLMTEEFYEKTYMEELWMLPDRAKELGVVHEIIGIDCTLDEVL